MAFCDFCNCEECRNGAKGLSHAPTIDGRWICYVCWRYDVCVRGKRAEGICGGPCEDKYWQVIDCPHRPKLKGEFRK